MSDLLERNRWRDLAATLAPEGRAFIDGAYGPARSGATFDSIDPATGAVIAPVAACGAEDVDAAVAAARRAFADGRWRALPVARRKRVLHAWAALVRKHRDELAVLETLDMGKPIRNTSRVDVPAAAECIAWYAEALDKAPDELMAEGADTIIVRRVPLGVVGAVVPWNFPLLMACWKIAPAIAAGNSVVLKPSERASLSCLRLAALAAEAGLPDGVLNVLPGLGDQAGRALGEHMDVDCIAFTGSTAVGRRFLSYAATSNLKAVWPECGGNSAQIVLPGADLAKAAKGIANGIFFNQGQVCNAGRRLLVHRSLHDDLLDRLVCLAERLEPRDPLDEETRFGPLVDEAHRDDVLASVDAALDDGGRLATGAIRLSSDGAGAFLQPTIVAGIDRDNTLWRQEVFGPVLAVTAFDDPAAALSLAADSPYAIAAGVWTEDAALARRVADGLQVGTVWVNTFDRHAMTTPFGGFRQSGYGRDRSRHALDKYTGLKTLWSAA